MGYYAKIVSEIVVDVQSCEDADLDLLKSILPGEWIKCSYNTRGGVHLLGGTPLRKNYPGVGYAYDRIRDAFIPPKPDYPSWVLNEDTCIWEAPVPYPSEGGPFEWNEGSVNWDLIENPIT